MDEEQNLIGPAVVCFVLSSGDGGRFRLKTLSYRGNISGQTGGKKNKKYKRQTDKFITKNVMTNILFCNLRRRD